MLPQVDRPVLVDTSNLAKRLKTRQYQRFLDELDLLTSFSRCALRPYDRYKDITPYDESVTKEYKLEKYINASFVTADGDHYIACQEPMPAFRSLFVEFLLKCDAEYLICLEKNLHYLRGYPIAESKTETLDGAELLTDQIYKIGDKTLRVVKCSVWKDHCVLDRKQMEKLWEYTLDIPRDKLKIIHCKAGVGRTGTFIMFRALKEIENVTIEKFIELLIGLRRQRTKMVYRVCQLKFLAEYFLENELDFGI